MSSVLGAMILLVAGSMMPFWYFGVLAGSVGMAFLLRESAGGGSISLSALIFGASILMTVAFLVPLNNRISRWSPDEFPSDWRIHSQHWDRMHVLRLVLIIVGSVALVVGILR